MEKDYEDLMFRQKMHADDILLIIFLFSFILVTFTLTLITFMSLIIYPTLSVLIYGIIKIRYGFLLKDSKKSNKILTVFVGIGSILFSCFILWLFFSEPTIGIEIVVYLIAYPIILVGIAGIVKGYIIKEYSLKIRLANIIIGILTVITAFSSYILSSKLYVLFLIFLLFMLLFSIFVRTAMYLSEYNLSIKYLYNFRYIFYIISDYPRLFIIEKIKNEKLN
ncbi:MAG: hypothetical protein ACFE85_00480 [Candidatus Hodarchaeota archaeon]